MKDIKYATCPQCKNTYVGYSMKHRTICRTCNRKNSSKRAVAYARTFKTKGFKLRKKCPDCNKPIRLSSTRCLICSAKYSAKHRRTNN